MPLHFMDGGGVMGAAIRSFDWSQNPLGPPAEWPPTLKSTVALMLASRFPKCIVWGPDFITLYNDAFRPILGEKPEALGRPFNEVWAEAWDKISTYVHAAFSGESTYLEDWPLTINRHGYPEETWFTFCYSPIRDEFGHIVGMMDTVIEMTSKIMAERQAVLLNQELAHRMKNILAVVRAIASQTFSNATEMDAAHRTFEARLIALSSAHDILTSSAGTGSSIDAVVDAVLKPLILLPERLTCHGRPVQLGSRQSLSLALALHELATNASKYGALSTNEGEVEIRWETGVPGSEDAFSFAWMERGGPPVDVPTRQGFGSKLISRVLAHDFKGKSNLDYHPDGVKFTLECRMSDLVDMDM